MAGADDEFLWEFLVESYENLDTIDAKLVGLETTENPDDIAAIFRAMHTIKGTSGFFGFGLVERLGHVAENLLGKIRDGELRLTAERASALLTATDGLRGLFAGIEATGTEPPRDIEPLVNRLAALTTGETFEDTAEIAAEPAAAAEATPPAEAALVVEVAATEAAPAAAAPAERRTKTRRTTAATPAKERRTKARRLTDQVPAVAALEEAMATEDLAARHERARRRRRPGRRGCRGRRCHGRRWRVAAGRGRPWCRATGARPRSAAPDLADRRR